MMVACSTITTSGPKKRAVLALLLLEPGRVVPTGRLMEELWRGNPPPGAAATLRSYVSRLRAVLGPDAVLEGRGGGYVITVQSDDVDAGRFGWTGSVSPVISMSPPSPTSTPE
jgi:DNA-binding SARP family transcriptional activator